MAFLFVTAFTAGYQNVVDNYLPAGDRLLAGLSVVLMVVGLAIIVDAGRNCIVLLRQAPDSDAGEQVA